MSHDAAPPELHRPQDFIFVRDLCEVYLLLDHISGRWDKSMPDEGIAHGLGKEAPWIEEVCRIGWPAQGTAVERAKQAAALLYAKDRLNAAAKPATGATIAFTLMVVGEEKGAIHHRRASDEASTEANARDPVHPAGLTAGFSRPLTRLSLAHHAFPGLISGAHAFQRRIRRTVYALCGFLFLTCVLSWYVLAGNIILTHLDAVHAQIREIEKTTLVADGGESAGAGSVKRAVWDVHSCEPQTKLPKAPVSPQATADTARICAALAAKTEEHHAISANLDRWLGTTDHPNVGSPVREHHADDEEFSRILSQVLANAVLPFCYGLLGAGAAVLRDLWAKMKESLLSPRDYTLAMGQLALGAIIGACVGLFVTPPGTGAAADNVLSGAVLSASALSFVAGFGVEGVFLALESLVKRVFNTPDMAKRLAR